jgi:hypothetical protein
VTREAQLQGAAGVMLGFVVAPYLMYEAWEGRGEKTPTPVVVLSTLLAVRYLWQLTRG